MFNNEAIELLEEQFVNRIEKVSSELLNKIGKRITDIGSLTASDLNKLKSLSNITGDIDWFNKELAKITNKNIKEIELLYKKSAEEIYKRAKPNYEYNNANYVKFKDNKELIKYYKSMAKLTAEKFINISNTTGFSFNKNGKVVYSTIAKKYQELVDTAITQMSLGLSTRDEQVKKILKEMANSGIKTIDYANGYSKRLDSAIRQNVGDGLGELMQGIQNETGKQFGANGVEITAHSLCSEDHQAYQGKQYTNKEYEKLQNSLHRQIGSWNCRHRTYSIIVGINTPAYTKQELTDRINESNKEFEFEGETFTMYQGTQLQRKIETEIRKQKDAQILYKASNNIDLLNETETKINQLTIKYNKLSKISGLPTKKNRLKVAGYHKNTKIA